MCFIQQKMSFLNRKLLSAEVNFEVPLTFTTLWTISADNTFDDSFLVFPGNRIWHLMQTVSSWDNVHEMSNPVSWEKKNKKII